MLAAEAGAAAAWVLAAAAGAAEAWVLPDAVFSCAAKSSSWSRRFRELLILLLEMRKSICAPAMPKLSRRATVASVALLIMFLNAMFISFQLLYCCRCCYGCFARFRLPRRRLRGGLLPICRMPYRWQGRGRHLQYLRALPFCQEEYS